MFWINLKIIKYYHDLHLICDDKLPSIENWYSLLTDRKTSEEGYKHVINVLNKSENNKILSRLAFNMWW